MAKFVLVPGAWIGGWAWQGVARRLRRAGHDVYPVTLTGLGERVHLGGPQVDLETHIADVVNLLDYEALERDVVLVGHSYAAVVVTAVADRVPERLSRLIYLDSAPLPDGQGMLDFYPPEEVARMDALVQQQGEGWKLPYPGVEQLGPPPMLEGLGPAERALLDGKATAHPFGSYRQRPRLQRKTGDYRRVIIACNGFRYIEKIAPALVGFLTPEWRRLDLATGHWPMLSAPEALAKLLSEAAS